MSLLLACAFLERLTSLWQFPYFFLAKKEKKMREIVPRRGGKGGGGPTGQEKPAGNDFSVVVLFCNFAKTVMFLSLLRTTTRLQ